MALVQTPEGQAITDQMSAQNAVQAPAPTLAPSAPVATAGPAALAPARSSDMDAADAALQLRQNAPAPGSFGSKLATALDQTPLELKPNGKPAPGSWAKSLVGATQSVLAGFGDIPTGKAPVGGGITAGISGTIANRNQRLAAAAAEKRKEQQQDEENRRANEKEDDAHQKSMLDFAVANRDGKYQEKAAHELKINDPLIAQGKNMVALLTDPRSGHAAPVSATDINSDELMRGVIDNKWNTHDYTYYPTGKEVAGEDKDGAPIYRNLYTVVANGGPIQLDVSKNPGDSGLIKFLNDNLATGDQKITDGQKFDNLSQLNSLYQRAANNYTALEATKQAAVRNGLMDQAQADQIAAVQAKPIVMAAIAQFVDPMAAFDAAMKQAQKDPAYAKQLGDPFEAFRSSMGKDKEGNSVFDKLYEKRQEVTADSEAALVKVENNPGEMAGEKANDIIARAKQEINDPNVKPEIKARWQKVYNEAATSHMLTEDDKKNEKSPGKLDYSGDTHLSGQAFLDSMQDARARAMVKAMGEGSLGVKNISQIVARNPEFLGDVALAYPDFKVDKAATMLDVYKDYESGKTAQTIQSIDAALQHMRDFAELTTPEAFAPKSAAYAKRLSAINTAAQEMARYYSNGQQPTVEEIEDAKKTLALSLGDTPESWTAGVRQNAQQMAQKLNSLQNRWTSSMPSPQFAANNPMPNLSAEARAAARMLGVDIDHVAPPNTNTAVTSATMPGKTPAQAPIGVHNIVLGGKNYQTDVNGVFNLNGVQMKMRPDGKGADPVQGAR